MPPKRDPIPVICARCARPFTLTPHAYARRVASRAMDLFHNNLNSCAPDPGTDRGPMSSSYSLTGPMGKPCSVNSA